MLVLRKQLYVHPRRFSERLYRMNHTQVFIKLHAYVSAIVYCFNEVVTGISIPLFHDCIDKLSGGLDCKKACVFLHHTYRWECCSVWLMAASLCSGGKLGTYSYPHSSNVVISATKYLRGIAPLLWKIRQAVDVSGSGSSQMSLRNVVAIRRIFGA